jgi:hypothetical protein
LTIPAVVQVLGEDLLVKIERIKELEGRGVVTRSVQPTSPPSVEYALTDLGAELQLALQAIVAVGHKLKRRASAKPSQDMAPAMHGDNVANPIG